MAIESNCELLHFAYYDRIFNSYIQRLFMDKMLAYRDSRLTLHSSVCIANQYI